LNILKGYGQVILLNFIDNPEGFLFGKNEVEIYILIRCCENVTGNPVKFRSGPAAVIGDERCK
jgi:hypothetical protein